MRCSSRTFRTPTCAMPRAPPPLRARPIRGWRMRASGEISWAGDAPPASAAQTSAARPRARPARRGIGPSIPSGRGTAVDLHDGVEQAQGVGLLALEGVAPDDRSEAAAVADGAHLLEDLLLGLGRAAGEDHDAPAGEGGLRDVPHPI